MRRLPLYIVCVLLWGVAACGNAGDSHTATFVPRPTAFPRLLLYDTVYADAGLPAGFRINASAVVTDVTPADRAAASDSRWIDIIYPAYGAALHCTFMPVNETTRGGVMANRTERISLNLGDNIAEQIELTSHEGVESIIIVTKGTSLTPVQFLSEGRHWVINGALQFNDGHVNVDSVLPIIEAIRTDLIHAAGNLKQ